MFKLLNIEEEPFWHTASIIFFLYLWMHRNTNNSSSLAALLFWGEKINSLCRYMHASVPVWLDFTKKKKGEHHLLWSYSAQALAAHLTSILPRPWPCLCFSLLFSLCLCRLSAFSLLLSIFPPFSLSFSFLVSSRLHPNLSHSCTCHRYLKIGSCMRAICNTTAAISRLHHQPGNVKLETYCLSGQSCTDAIAGDALTYCVKFVMKCCSIIYIFAPFDQEMIGKDAILTFLPIT